MCCLVAGSGLGAKYLLIALLALFGSLSVLAQEPVVGVADPESLFNDDDPQLHANKQVALRIMRSYCNAIIGMRPVTS
jgi:hypothetical protein